jgi:Carboxypeptidase regulatory-like domain
MPRISLTICLLALVINAHPQNARDVPPRCLVSGRVMDAVTNQPLASAEVVADAVSGGEQGVGEPASAITDAAGKFHIADLSCGRYALRTSHEGYTNQLRSPKAGSGIVSLAPASQVNEIVVLLTPGGTIAGRVRDENGSAISGAELQAMKQVCGGAGCELQEVASVTASTKGEYRLTGLQPGRYYVRASRPTSVEPVREQVRVPLYYPGIGSLRDATSLAVHAGEPLTGIDVTFTPVATVHVSGRVMDSRDILHRDVELTLLGDDGAIFYSTGKSDADGKFDLPDIPAGSYVLVGQQADISRPDRKLWAAVRVEVGDVKVENVTLVLSPGTEINGYVRVEGKTSIDLSELSMQLEPQEGVTLNSLTPAVEEAGVRSDGRFSFANVSEGQYGIDLSPLPPGYYMEAGGEPETLEDGIYVGAGRPVPPLEIVLRPGAASVEGTVQADQPAAGAFLALVPGGKRRQQRRFYKTSVSNRFGHFSMRGLAPGDYKLFAWDQIEPGAFLDPDFLVLYEDRGQSVHIGEGAHALVQVPLITTGESR